jgi:predicted transcriptional regulator
MSEPATEHRSYLNDPEFLAQVEEGRADHRAGRWVSLEAVRRWVFSLGTDKEMPPPECP